MSIEILREYVWKYVTQIPDSMGAVGLWGTAERIYANGNRVGLKNHLAKVREIYKMYENARTLK